MLTGETSNLLIRTHARERTQKVLRQVSLLTEVLSFEAVQVQMNKFQNHAPPA